MAMVTATPGVKVSMVRQRGGARSSRSVIRVKVDQYGAEVVMTLVTSSRSTKDIPVTR